MYRQRNIRQRISTAENKPDFTPSMVSHLAANASEYVFQSPDDERDKWAPKNTGMELAAQMAAQSLWSNTRCGLWIFDQMRGFLQYEVRAMTDDNTTLEGNALFQQGPKRNHRDGSFTKSHLQPTSELLTRTCNHSGVCRPE